MSRAEQPPRSRARRLARLLLVVALLVALVPSCALLLLRHGATRERLLRSALRAAEETTGLALSARDLSIDPLDGRLALRDLAVAVPGSRPFLVLPTAEVRLDTAALLRRKVHVRKLSATGLRVDLGAPLPASEGKRTEDLPALGAAEIDEIDVTVASVVSGPLPAALQRVALAASLENARIGGSLHGGVLRLRADLPAVFVDRPGPLRLAAAGRAVFSATADGQLGLEGAVLEGTGISLAARGRAGLAPDAPLELHAEAGLAVESVAPELAASGKIGFSADVEGTRSAPSAVLDLNGRDLVHRLLAVDLVSARARVDREKVLLDLAEAELRPGGKVTADGRYELGPGRGSWRLAAVRLPDRLLDPFVAPATRERWGASGSTLHVQAGFQHTAGDPLLLSGDASLTLHRGETPLANVVLSLSAHGPAELVARASFLPGSAGERTASGTVRAASLAGLASGRLEEGRAHLSVPDLAAAHAELRALFPSVVPVAPEGIDLAGPLLLDARASGPLRALRTTVDAGFRPARGGTLSLRATADAAPGSVDARVRVEGLDLGTLRPGATGLASADAEVSLGRGRREARLVVDATDVCLADDAPSVERLHADVVAAGPELTIVDLAASGGVPPQLLPGPLRLAGSGRLSLNEPFRDADLDATLSAGDLNAEAHALLRGGVLSFDLPAAGRPGLGFSLAGRLPLGALREVPALAERVPRDLPEGPIELTLDAPDLDSCAFGSLLPEGTEGLAARGDLRAFATFGLADPLAGTATVELGGTSLVSPAGRLSLQSPARLTLGGGRLALDPVTVAGERTSFLVSASADLVPGASPDAPLAALVSSVAASAHGRADAALLTPFLAGGTARGEIVVDASVTGPPDALAGRVLLDGNGSRFSWPVAYPTEIRDPLLEAELTPGQAWLSRGEALLNGGPLLLSGGWYQGVGTTLTALFADVRYRLAYGLASVLSGELTLDVIGDDRRVSGNVVLERGLLEREIDLDREILARVLAPPESPGTEASFLDTLALDLGIGTASGVRVRNNVADLSASWSRLDVTGTASRPVVRGRIEVERNGLVFAYGQTFRIDRGLVTYAGDPETDPRLDFVTTSSLEDPSIGAARGGSDLFAATRSAAAKDARSDDAGAALAEGLAGYYGNRLAGRLGAALGRVSLAVRPLVLLGETDAAARLTLSRELSPSVSLALGLDLKNAQRQTWVVDVHGLRRLPALAAQLFTEDYGRYGGALQQRLELGGSRGRGAATDDPLLASVRATPPAGVSRRSFVSALGLRKGGLAGRDALFEAEIDGEAFLREKGWPDAQVTLRAVPARKPGRVDVEVGIDAGPRAEISFAGDPLPTAARRAVAALYRTGLLEAGSLDEMRREALRALRSRGHVSPAVTVDTGGSEEERHVVVTVDSGRRIAVKELRLDGVGPAEAAALGRRFLTPLERVELASGLPSADGRLLDALRSLGYPNGRVEGRLLDADGRLSVTLDPGPPSLVDSVEVRGVPVADAERLALLARLSPGDVADGEKAALSALAVEEALRSEGYGKARVRPTLTPATPEDPPRLAVVLEVERGAAERLGSVRIEGLARTSPRWAERAADLAPGGAFRREDLDAARSSLFSLGLFRSVRGDVAPGPDGRVEVVLTAEELPPVTLAWGLRWEDERGFSAVVDATDRNLFGRGLLLGVRGLYDPEDRAVRLFAGVPEHLFGTGVDLWVERRRSSREGLYYGRRIDATEASLQLSRSLGRNLSARLYGRVKETRTFEADDFFPLDVTIRLPYLGAQLVKDTREDPLLGTRGLFASLDLQASGDWLGSSFAFGRAYAQVNLYRPVFTFGGRPVVWAQSMRAGAARAFEGQELIPDVRFYAGGSYSVRGYPTESLGPREDLGGVLYVTGGSALLVVNEELRVPVHARLMAVGFFDAGQVWESSSDFGSGLAKSLGLGVRALTPLGVLRLDAAFPLDRREGDSAWRLTFGFGNVF